MDGIGTALCWSPSGSLIAASQVLRDTITRVIFFERNGLRHREFDIENANPAHYRVAALQWNAESDVLAVLLDSVADGMHGSRLQTPEHLQLLACHIAKSAAAFVPRQSYDAVQVNRQGGRQPSIGMRVCPFADDSLP